MVNNYYDNKLFYTVKQIAKGSHINQPSYRTIVTAIEVDFPNVFYFPL